MVRFQVQRNFLCQLLSTKEPDCLLQQSYPALTKTMRTRVGMLGWDQQMWMTNAASLQHSTLRHHGQPHSRFPYAGCQSDCYRGVVERLAQWFWSCQHSRQRRVPRAHPPILAKVRPAPCNGAQSLHSLTKEMLAHHTGPIVHWRERTKLANGVRLPPNRSQGVANRQVVAMFCPATDLPKHAELRR